MLADQNSLSRAWIHYLVEVLGVRSIGARVEEGPGAKTEVAIVFYSEQVFGPEAQQLFLKMATAMKLKPQQYLLCHGSLQDCLPDLKRAQFVISFTQNFQWVEHSRWITTESPEVLLLKPELKRKVWSDLQSVMAKIKIEQKI